MIKVEKLTKQFGGLKAVSDVSFEVKEGQILGLIGPNGAGKTTCFNMIAGALPPSSGTVFFKGQEITGLKPNKICHLGIARTFQIVKPLKKLTVKENILVGALSKSKDIKEARKKAEEVIQLTEIEDITDLKASDLSIGNLKRLEMARALATSPEVLLLDEPLGGLTTKEVENAVKMTRKINQSGVTIIIIEHIMKALMSMADYIVVLQNGIKISEGTPKEVSADPEVIKAYLGEDAYA
ncbi:branched-chain amino acid transport system ATP-binding protein [Caldalkalibacillus uzonensis]|uniref:Branched-chain amino acid transport system ATP-binding protein n=1 Tax=Caldalkalibacillus uzonensis TaxID=353224 RepID=A0ABU0CNZ8_9BACI|nr:branched-chain amino acid transport system ATP-binding protein [Caldalkalibacillus uzonensis]